MLRSLQRIGLMARAKPPSAILHLLTLLAKHLSDQGLSVVIAENSANAKLAKTYPSVKEAVLGSKVDWAMVIGGDGTMLSAARLLAPYDVPLMGINQGRLGFMTDALPGDMLHAVDAVLAGNFTCEKRQLITASVERAKRVIAEGMALNDIVLSRGSIGQMIEFEVFIDEQFVYTQRSDGLIVTTPTGSTAYALAAGGPILHPTLPALSLVPVSPHSLSYRPIVMSDQAVITCVLISGIDACVHFDGQSRVDLKNRDHVVIKRSMHALELLHPVGYSYYDTLRGKLHWGKKLFAETEMAHPLNQ